MAFFRTSALSVLLPLLLLLSCSKHRDEPPAMTVSGFRLTAIIWADGRAIWFHYNGDNRIERIAIGTLAGINGEISRVDSSFEYEYEKGRCLRISQRCSCPGGGSVTEYHYNDDKQVDFKTCHAPGGSFAGVTRLRYDGQGRLAEARDSSAAGVVRRVYEYGSGDNLRSRTIFSTVAGRTVKRRRDWTAYDTKRSFIGQVPSLPVDDPNLERMMGAVSWTPCNYMATRDYAPVPEEQGFGIYYADQVTYEYNEADLPLSMRSDANRATFTYELY